MSDNHNGSTGRSRTCDRCGHEYGASIRKSSGPCLRCIATRYGVPSSNRQGVDLDV